MNTEQLKLARESGIDPTQDTLCRHGGWETPIEAFARACYEAGRTAERKECERLCARSWEIGGTLVAKEFAEAIRARGKP